MSIIKSVSALTTLSTSGFKTPSITKRALPARTRIESATAQSPYLTAFDQLLEADDPTLCVEVMSEGKNLKPIEAARNAQTKFNAAHKADNVKVVSRFLGIVEQEGPNGETVSCQVAGFWVVKGDVQ